MNNHCKDCPWRVDQGKGKLDYCIKAQKDATVAVVNICRKIEWKKRDNDVRN